MRWHRSFYKKLTTYKISLLSNIPPFLTLDSITFLPYALGENAALLQSAIENVAKDAVFYLVEQSDGGKWG